jgi:alpha-tubulin suppressor-like RCC1 family protein
MNPDHSRPAGLLGALLAMPLVVLAGCGWFDPSAASPPSPPPFAEAEVGAAGGTVATSNGASAVVPANALAAPATIRIEAVTEGYPPASFGSPKGLVYAFTPHGTVFSKPVKVSIPFEGAPSAELGLFTAEPGGSWRRVAGSAVVGSTVQGEVTGFSYFAPAVGGADGGYVPNIVAIAAGSWHTCAVSIEGDVYCWGTDYAGQLGLGFDARMVYRPRLVPGVKARSLAIGDMRTYALLDLHTVAGWGNNAGGVLGLGNAMNAYTPVSLGLSGTVSLSTSAYCGVADCGHTCSADYAGQVYCWGGNPSGGVGDGTTMVRSAPTYIGQYGSQISAGGLHTCVIASQSVYCWGSNSRGQLGDGTTATHLFPYPANVGTGRAWEISAGDSHTCIRYNGYGCGSKCTPPSSADSAGVWCWGDNSYGQLGAGLSPTTDPFRSTAVKVVQRQASGLVPVMDVRQMSSGSDRTCAAMADGTVTCWGKTSWSAFSSQAFANSAEKIPGIVDAQQVAVGSGNGRSHGCAIVANGKVVCWGANSAGQLGDGTTTSRDDPREVNW